jgi:hypothetical protein
MFGTFGMVDSSSFSDGVILEYEVMNGMAVYDCI